MKNTHNKLTPNNLTQEERNKLVEDNMNLVWYFVHKLCKDERLKEDCFQAGIVGTAQSVDGQIGGLIRAAMFYDPAKGQSFAAFASFEIQCSIRDFLFYNRSIRLPDAQRSGITAYYTKIGHIAQEEIELTSSMLYDTAKEFGLSDEVSQVLANPAVSLDEPYCMDSDARCTVGDCIDSGAETDTDCVDNMFMKSFLDSFQEVIEEDITSGKTPAVETASVVRLYFEQLAESLMNDTDAPRMLDVARELFPQFVANETDSAEVKKDKAHELDKIYCKANARWKKITKANLSWAKDYLALCY